MSACAEALRLAAIAAAHKPGYPPSMTYDFARDIWALWWEEVRREERERAASLTAQ